MESSPDSNSPELSQGQAEHNRNKSKRYYERKKNQRLLMICILSQFRHELITLYSKGCGTTSTWQAVDTILSVKKGLAEEINASPLTPEALSPKTNVNAQQRKRSHLLRQKQNETYNFSRLHHLALLLTGLLSHTGTTLRRVPVQGEASNDSLDDHARKHLLSAWVNLKYSWKELDATEARLSPSGGSKPIAALNLLLSH